MDTTDATCGKMYIEPEFTMPHPNMPGNTLPRVKLAIFGFNPASPENAVQERGSTVILGGIHQQNI